MGVSHRGGNGGGGGGGDRGGGKRFDERYNSDRTRGSPGAGSGSPVNSEGGKNGEEEIVVFPPRKREGFGDERSYNRRRVPRIERRE